ncbi:hypothetical protein sos41_19670 [Alphaproteobacteria bacterium SO-S41]|nr:hypothetical protein sos41_19670 [Alphaproteobacteria bacterium SO-S41]
MRFFGLVFFAAALGVAPVNAAPPDTYGARIDAALATASGEAGGDPAKALAWVQDKTDYEAYRGKLRGARGAYATGRANSVDQALLLQAVLKPAKSRFASCTLSDADAVALAATALSSQPLLIERAETLANEVTDARVKDGLMRLAAAWTGLKAVQAEEGAALADAVTAAGLTFAGPDVATLKREAAATQVWLQVESGGAWVDLDPTIDGGAPGATRCAATATFETLPAALRHRVVVSLVADLRTAAGPERRELLHHEADAAELAYDDTLLFFAEAQGAKTEADAAAVKTGAFAYTPVLRIGATDVTGTPLLAAAPKTGFDVVGATTAEAAGGATDLIGGMPVGENAEPEPAPAPPPLAEEPVAAFLELTLLSPDQVPATVAAPIFDRLGEAARAAGTADAPLKDLAETEGDYAELATIWTVGVMPGAALRPFAPELKTAAADDTFAQIRLLAAAARGFEPMEGALLRAVGLAPLTTHVRPRLLLVGLGPTGLGDAMRVTFTADLAASGAEDAPDAAETATQRAARAVARVLAERLAIGVAGMPVPGGDKLPAVDTARDLLTVTAAARGQGLAWAAGTPAFDDPDANALAAAHVAAGRLVLLPPGSVEVGGERLAGWWVADAKLGLLYDELGDGRSNESADYNNASQPARQSAPAIGRTGCIVRRLVMVAAVGMGLLTSAVDPTATNHAMQLAEEWRAAEEAAEAAAEHANAPPGPGGC